MYLTFSEFSWFTSIELALLYACLENITNITNVWAVLDGMIVRRTVTVLSNVSVWVLTRISFSKPPCPVEGSYIKTDFLESSDNVRACD